MFEATVDVPATTADLRLVGTFIADALDGLGLVATSTAGVFLAVLRDDMTSDATQRIADAALRADPPETVGDSPIEPRPDPDPVGALAQAHVADLRNRIAQLANTVALLPASRRRAAARAAVIEIDRRTADVLRSLGIDDSTV